MSDAHIPSEVTVPKSAWEALTGLFGKMATPVAPQPGKAPSEAPGASGGPSSVEKATPRTLYVRRDLKNASEFIAWAKGQGFDTTLPAGELHVTICYSKQPIDWMKVPASWNGGDSKGELTISPGGPRVVEKMGDKGAIALLFNASELSWRHMDLREAGASYDWPDYQPHVTITWQGGDIDPAKVEPYRGKLVFGPEIFEEIKENWSADVVEKKQVFEIAKVGSDEQRMIYGWASVISKDGKPYFDSEGDTIDADELEKATIVFMKDARFVSDHHERHEDGSFSGELTKGQVIHSFPITKGIMDALGIQCAQEGWIIGVYCADDALWKGVKDGAIKGFSIGGRAMREAV